MVALKVKCSCFLLNGSHYLLLIIWIRGKTPPRDQLFSEKIRFRDAGIGDGAFFFLCFQISGGEPARRRLKKPLLVSLITAGVSTPLSLDVLANPFVAPGSRMTSVGRRVMAPSPSRPLDSPSPPDRFCRASRKGDPPEGFHAIHLLLPFLRLFTDSSPRAPALPPSPPH